MKKILVLLSLVSAAAVFIFFTGAPLVQNKKLHLQSGVRPGDLSAAHANLSTNCQSCHTAFERADDAKCISCHATNKELLQRQPTAFHAIVSNCGSCHTEHQGVNANLRVMNHEMLAKIGQKKIDKKESSSFHTTNPALPEAHPLVSALEARLDCAGCHSTKDKHTGLFGQNCASCHATTQWTIPAFQHPSVRSVECNQCHQAPPSHYMEHFTMISQKVAGQKKALVNQCYLCHQTTSFNDIKGVGYYKHH